MLRLIAAVVCRLSPRGAARLAALLGGLLFCVLRARRGVCIRNLAAAFPGRSPRQLRTLAAASYRHYGSLIVDYLRLPLLDDAAARALVDEDTRARLDALRYERGLLVLVGHLGYWDSLACAAARVGLPLHVVTRRIKTGWLQRYWTRLRRDCGVELLPARGSALTIRRALRRGDLVALAIDQHEPGGAVVPFFGRPAATSLSLARLALDSHAPVVAAFLLDTPDGRRLRVVGPLDGAPKGQGEDPATTLTRWYTEVLEEEIRAVPEQWFWVHRRWKAADQGREANHPSSRAGDVSGRT